MKKTYQIKMNQGKDSKVLDVTPAGTKGQAVTIKAEAGARYQLVDTETNFGPENIRASRQGKDLKISFEGSNTTDLVIEDYFKVSPEGYNGLIGETEGGKFYEYIPESASGMASVPMLAESGPVVGMALGGAEVAPSGAAVGVLAAGLFSPWLLGAGALAAAAGGGGGGAAAAAKDTTAPSGQTGALLAVKDNDTGVVGDNRTNVTKPTITGKAEANSTVEISLVDPSGKTTGPYKTMADASGNYSLVVPDNLVDNATDTKGTQYTPVIKVTDASGNSSTANGTPFVIDTKALAVNLSIDVDANNDGVITVIENGNSTKKGSLNVTASFDSSKANVGDEIHFQMTGGADQKVTLTQAMINAGLAVFSFVDSIVDKAVLSVSSWFVDAAQNQSAAAKDEAIVDLKVAVHLGSIAGDNMINAAEATTGGVVVKGTATALGTVALIIGATQIGSTTVNSDGSWRYQTDGMQFSQGASLDVKLSTNDQAVAIDSLKYTYDTRVEVLVENNSSTGKNTLQSKESGANKMVAYKTSANDLWLEIPDATSVILPDSAKFLLADVSGNVYTKFSDTPSQSVVVEYSTLNKSTNPSDLTLSQLLASSDGLHIDIKTLAVKSVSIADGKANTLNIDLLDVLNHGVLDVLNAGLGKNPQFRIDGDKTDTLKLTNHLSGLGEWTSAETVVSGGQEYLHYFGYALGLEVDLLVDKDIQTTIV